MTKKSAIRRVMTLPRQAVVGLIRVYQRTLSPDHGVMGDNPLRGCRYYPSCSEYTARSVQKRGVTLGIAKGSWRILRCNPFSPGGVDESY